MATAVLLKAPNGSGPSARATVAGTEEPMNQISYSEVQALNRCERLWSYSFQRNLIPHRPDAKMHSGEIMHKLLATHYKGDDWEAPWVEMRRAAVEAALFTEEKDETEADFDLYGSVMTRYITWAQSTIDRDTSYVVSVEEPRVAANLKFTPDLVFHRNGSTVLRDFKTMRNFDDDMELRLDYDPQPSFYAWGLGQNGIPIDTIEHVYLRMRVPAEPKINKDGSMSKVHVITDEVTVREFLARTGARCSDAELQDYLAKLPQEPFFRVYQTVRTQDELDAMAAEIRQKLVRRGALSASDLSPVRSLMRDCTRCAFFRPCMTALKGGDEEVLLAENYRVRDETDEWQPSLEVAE